MKKTWSLPRPRKLWKHSQAPTVRHVLSAFVYLFNWHVKKNKMSVGNDQVSGHLAGWMDVAKTCLFRNVLDSMDMMKVKLCMMVAFIELHLFNPFKVTCRISRSQWQYIGWF